MFLHVRYDGLKHLIAGWLVVQIFLIALNQAMFMHTHRLPDGTTIVHAHPFKTDKGNTGPFQKHHHSKIEFLFFGSVSLLFAIAIIAFILRNFIQVNLYIFPVPAIYKERYISHKNGRAPPLIRP